jgi:hypothetical protein
MASDSVVQIVITRRGANTFRVVTFSKKECLDSHSMDSKDAGDFILETMKQLKALPPAP